MKNLILFVTTLSIIFLFIKCTSVDPFPIAEQDLELRENCCRGIDKRFESEHSFSFIPPNTGLCCLSNLIVSFSSRFDCAESIEIFKDGELLLNLADDSSMSFSEEVCMDYVDGSTYSVYVNGELCQSYTMPGNINCIFSECDEVEIDIANQINNTPSGLVLNAQALTYLNNYFTLNNSDVVNGNFTYDDMQFLDCYKDKLGDLYYGDIEDCDAIETLNFELKIGTNLSFFNNNTDQNISADDTGGVLGIFNRAIELLNVEIEEIQFCNEGTIYLEDIAFYRLGNCNNPQVCDYFAVYSLVCCN